MELFFVLHVYGFNTWSRNFTEMTGIEIYSCTLKMIMMVLVVILVSWMIMMIMTVIQSSVAIFSVSGAVSGVMIMMMPMTVFMIVTMVKLVQTEGKTLSTKMRIGLQSNLETCSCHGMLRNCPYSAKYR